MAGDYSRPGTPVNVARALLLLLRKNVVG